MPNYKECIYEAGYIVITAAPIYQVKQSLILSGKQKDNLAQFLSFWEL